MLYRNIDKIADQSEYERPWDKTNEPTVDNHLDVQDIQVYFFISGYVYLDSICPDVCLNVNKLNNCNLY